MSFPVLAKVSYWDDDCGNIRSRVNLLNVYSFADAAKQLEDYYGNDLESMELNMYEDGLITMPCSMYDELKKIMENGVDE